MQEITVIKGDKRWLINMGTFRQRNFTYAILFLVIVMLGAVVIACLIPIYSQPEKKSSEKSNPVENPLF